MQDKNEKFAYVAEWKRNITLHEKRLLLETESRPGLTYAFYLEHNKMRQKKYYGEESAWEFEISRMTGHYVAVFFYKDGEEKTSIRIPFWITEAGDVFHLTRTTIATGEKYLIEYHDIGSEVTFVVFNGYESTLKTPPFGLSFLLNQGYNVISCNQDNDQYQSLSFEEFGRLVAPLVEGKKTFLYGSSLGGYCAVYYAGAIDGHVIAAAPRNSAHPKLIAKAEGKTLFKPEEYLHKEIGDNKLTNGAIYIFIDPYVNMDVFFLEEFITSNYKNVKIMAFEHAGHEVLLHVNKSGQLSKTIKGIVEGNPELEIDYSLDSEVTEIGKAHFYLSTYNHSKALHYINRARLRETSNRLMQSRLQAAVRALKKISKPTDLAV